MITEEIPSYFLECRDVFVYFVVIQVSQDKMLQRFHEICVLIRMRNLGILITQLEKQIFVYVSYSFLFLQSDYNNILYLP